MLSKWFDCRHSSDAEQFLLLLQDKDTPSSLQTMMESILFHTLSGFLSRLAQEDTALAPSIREYGGDFLE